MSSNSIEQSEVVTPPSKVGLTGSSYHDLGSKPSRYASASSLRRGTSGTGLSEKHSAYRREAKLYRLLDSPSNGRGRGAGPHRRFDDGTGDRADSPIAPAVENERDGGGSRARRAACLLIVFAFLGLPQSELGGCHCLVL